MSELEDRVNELEDTVNALERRNDELYYKLSDLEDRFEAFAEPCAIGSEQLWKVVFNDILKKPVPSGVDLIEILGSKRLWKASI